jgi:solute carrier family 35 protein E3
LKFILTVIFKWVGEKQKEFNVNSMQLLFYQAPMSALFLMLIIPFFEKLVGPYGVFSDWSKEAQVDLLEN